MKNKIKYQININNINCNDYRNYVEVFFVANYLKFKKLPGLKILCRSELKGELREELINLNESLLIESDKLIVNKKIMQFVNTLKSALQTTTYELSKELWVVQLYQLLSGFSLEPRQVDFLKVHFHFEFNQELKYAMDNSNINSFKEYFSFLESIFNLPSNHFNGILNEDSALIELGIVSVNWNSPNEFCDRIDLARNLIAAVNSSEQDKNLMCYFCKFEKKTKLNLESFQCYQNDAEKIKKILQKAIQTSAKGINILLYGLFLYRFHHRNRHFPYL